MTQQDLRTQLDTLPPEQVIVLLCDQFLKMECRAETAEQQLAAFLAGNTPQQQIARRSMKSFQGRTRSATANFAPKRGSRA